MMISHLLLTVQPLLINVERLKDIVEKGFLLLEGPLSITKVLNEQTQMEFFAIWSWVSVH